MTRSTPDRPRSVRSVLPRRFWRYPVRGSFAEQLTHLSPRQRYIAQQSIARWERNYNAGCTLVLSLGEIGAFQGVRIIRSQLE